MVAQLQPLFLILPIDKVLAHLPALTVQQHADHPIPVAHGSARFPGCASATRSTAPGGLLLISILATAFDSLRACGSSVRKIETIRGITEGSTRTPEHQRVSYLRQPKEQLEEAAPPEGKLKRSRAKPHTMALCEGA
jgi:hypothetical protein